MGEIVALYTDVFRVALVHGSPSLLKSQSAEGRLVSLMRADGSVNVTSSFPRTASIRARLATRWMSRPQVGQMPRRLPRASVRGHIRPYRRRAPWARDKAGSRFHRASGAAVLHHGAPPERQRASDLRR